MFTITPAPGKTFAQELEAAADLLRSGRSPIDDRELSGSVADLLDSELVRARLGGQPTSAAIRTARAVAAQVLRREARQESNKRDVGRLLLAGTDAEVAAARVQMLRQEATR